MTLTSRALKFATEAHATRGKANVKKDAAGVHVRKYSGEPYIVHPISVAAIVSSVKHTEEMVASALLHDVVEDTTVTLEEIEVWFGERVCELVYWLTDVSRPEDGNRKARKDKDRDHIAMAPAEAQTIKLADVIHNTYDIVENDPGFARTYLKEMVKLLKVLVHGDLTLYAQACEAVYSGLKKVYGDKYETLFV